MGQAGAGMGAAQSLMTPEERTALREKMHNAKTPEERQKLSAPESEKHTH
jgi:Spy/CpxP family protein refolding chaperone